MKLCNRNLTVKECIRLTITARTLLFKVGAGHDEAGVAAVSELVGFGHQTL